MSEGNSNTGAFLAGFIVGGLAGAAAALMMTPQSGEEMRLKLQERGVGLKGQFGDLRTEARGRVEKRVADLQERGKVILEERRQASDATGEEEPETDAEA
jgi:gas vesicle protein